MFLDESLRPRLVHRPGLLEVGDRFGDSVLLDTMVDFLPDPSDALGEAEGHREHFAVPTGDQGEMLRSEEHTSELQSLTNLVCRLLLEKKKIYLVPASAQRKRAGLRPALAF